MSDAFHIIPYQVKAAGTDVPPEQVQAAINDLAFQTTIDLNLLASQPISPALFAAAFLIYFNALPKTLPGTAGVIWNNGGTLAQS
jgi:hypothetical protein